MLKPAVMRREDPGGTKGGSAPYNPAMEVPHPEVPLVKFEIEVNLILISHCLCRKWIFSVRACVCQDLLGIQLFSANQIISDTLVYNM